MSLRIDEAAEAVELVLPPGVSMAKGMAFLDSQRGWVVSRLAAQPPRVPFADGAVVPLLGVPHAIRHLGPFWRQGARIGKCQILVGGETQHLPRRVRDAIAALARRELTRRARALAERIGRKVTRVSVRDTKSRWGSCSTEGSLAFSWRLVLAPESVLDYVVAHEVAHLQHMDHGPRFWRLVEELAPGAGVQREWLRQNRARLLRYG